MVLAGLNHLQPTTTDTGKCLSVDTMLMEIPTTSHTIYRGWGAEGQFSSTEPGHIIYQNDQLDELIPNLALVSLYNELYMHNSHLTMWHFWYLLPE